jgi:FkbM family methyltransferase
MNDAKERLRRSLWQRPALYEWALRATARTHHWEVRALRALIRPGDTIFDVGANVGQFAFIAAGIAGRRGAVHAFEPVPESSLRLEQRVQNWPLANVVLNHLAVSDAEGTAEIHVPAGDLTQASLIHHKESSWAKASMEQSIATQVVTTITLDAYRARNDLPVPAFIKCDVEGAELLALRGASEMLVVPTPPILFVEILPEWSRDFGYEPQDLLRFVEGHGYQVFHFGPQGRCLVSSAMQELPGTFPDYLNYVCVHPEAHRERAAAFQNKFPARK